MVIETLKRLIFRFCIGLQKGIVMRLLKGVFGKMFEKERNNDLRPSVLQLEDEINFVDRTSERLSKSVNQLIQKGAKSQPDNLIDLIREKSNSGFHGVEKFNQIDPHLVLSLPAEVDYEKEVQDISDVGYRDCWRLPVVTLTTVVVSLPRI